MPVSIWTTHRFGSVFLACSGPLQSVAFLSSALPGIGPVATPLSAPIAMVVTPTRPLLASAALQRIGRHQGDSVLLHEAALRAVQALMAERRPRM